MKNDLGTVYTLDEAAAHLRMTNRGVAKVARQHGLCMINGRHLTFTDRDIEAIKDAMRLAPELSFARPSAAPSSYAKLSKLTEDTRTKSGSVSDKARAILLARSKKRSHLEKP